VQKVSPLYKATEGADFSKLGPDPVDVAKIKVAYNLVLLTGFQRCEWLAHATPNLGIMPEQKSDLF